MVDPSDSEALEASKKKASEVASKLTGTNLRQRGKVGGLEDDDSDKAKPGELEFVKTKDVKLQDRKWAQEQAGPSKATRPRVGSLPLHLKLVVIACSTLGLLLFGYRMYQQHYSPKPKQYLLFTKDQLKQMGDPAKGRPMIAIMGEVYDVSAAPQYYGKDGSYSFFSGRDASRAYITGKFGDDLNDNVEDFTDDNMAGLVHWKEFFLKEYKYVGRVEGAFFDKYGRPTKMIQRVLEATERHKIAQLKREHEQSKYPPCSTKWSQNEGSEVWCDEESFPRLLTEMISGKAQQRCACFKEVGWSNLRKVYDGCDPTAHRCKVATK